MSGTVDRAVKEAVELVRAGEPKDSTIVGIWERRCKPEGRAGVMLGGRPLDSALISTPDFKHRVEEELKAGETKEEP